MSVQLKCPLCGGTSFEAGHVAAKSLIFVPQGQKPRQVLMSKLFQKSWIRAQVCQRCQHILLFRES